MCRPKGALDAKLLAQRRAIDVNQTFLHAVVAVHAGGGGDGHAAGRVPLGGPVDLSTLPRLTASPHQFSKVASTLHQLVRDWSEEGAPERELCYTPLLDELVVRLPVTPSNKNKQRVLVPGSGLGRLAFEIACRGYVTQGNEFAYHMLLTGSVCLNRYDGLHSVGCTCTRSSLSQPSALAAWAGRAQWQCIPGSTNPAITSQPMICYGRWRFLT